MNDYKEVNNSTALEVFSDDAPSFVVDLTSGTSAYCSLKPTTNEDKAKLYNAMNNPSHRIGDCINQTIKVKDLFCEVVTCNNKETGESNVCPRIVLIDEKGDSYQAVSIGVYSAVKRLIQIFGEPTWEQPIPIVVKQITRGANKMLTFEIK